MSKPDINSTLPCLEYQNAIHKPLLQQKFLHTPPSELTLPRVLVQVLVAELKPGEFILSAVLFRGTLALHIEHVKKSDADVQVSIRHVK